MEQMAQYYWSMLGARTAAAAATSLRSWPPPAHGNGEPSWEELAFARDAAGHLGGCVWPPRSYTCTFCRREFRSAQALGGHMNVHRRDRARLRECASPDHDVAHQTKQQQQSIIAPPADRGQLLQLQESISTTTTTLFRAKAAVLISGSGRSSTCDCDHHLMTYNYKEEAVTASTSPSYISTIPKESKNKLVISSAPAATAGTKQALAVDDEEVVAERRKRRRPDQQPFFLASSKGGQHDAKVPKVITSRTSPNSLHLAGRQEVDLELRLGISPNK